MFLFFFALTTYVLASSYIEKEVSFDCRVAEIGGTLTLPDDHHDKPEQAAFDEVSCALIVGGSLSGMEAVSIFERIKLVARNLMVSVYIRVVRSPLTFCSLLLWRDFFYQPHKAIIFGNIPYAFHSYTAGLFSPVDASSRRNIAFSCRHSLYSLFLSFGLAHLQLYDNHEGHCLPILKKY